MLGVGRDVVTDICTGSLRGCAKNLLKLSWEIHNALEHVKSSRKPSLGLT